MRYKDLTRIQTTTLKKERKRKKQKVKRKKKKIKQTRSHLPSFLPLVNSRASLQGFAHPLHHERDGGESASRGVSMGKVRQ